MTERTAACPHTWMITLLIHGETGRYLEIHIIHNIRSFFISRRMQAINKSKQFYQKQAGAELCQAQDKFRSVRLALDLFDLIDKHSKDLLIWQMKKDFVKKNLVRK